MHYEIYFSSHFLFVVIRTSACASANDRKENDEKNKSHDARETCVNWVIAWTKKLVRRSTKTEKNFPCPANAVLQRRSRCLRRALIFTVCLKNPLVHHSWWQQTWNENFFSYYKYFLKSNFWAFQNLLGIKFCIKNA